MIEIEREWEFSVINKNKPGKKRLKWSKPEIIRIAAGSAESGLTVGRADGGTSPNQKNFS